MAAIDGRDRQIQEGHPPHLTWYITFHKYSEEKRNNVKLSRSGRATEPMDLTSIDAMLYEKRKEKLMASVSIRTNYTRRDILTMDMVQFMIIIDALQEEDEKNKKATPS